MVRTSSSTVIRAARADDADRIGRIHVVSWQEAYADALPGSFLQGLSISERQQRWRQRLTAPDWPVRALVVARDGIVAGFACVGESRDDTAVAGTGELQSIYLDPEYWGHGLGRRLHDAALETLRQEGYVRATLWVLDGNARARRFYERIGWVLDGETKVDSIAGSPPVTEVRYGQALCHTIR